jgi:hypothetical protein
VTSRIAPRRLIAPRSRLIAIGLSLALAGSLGPPLAANAAIQSATTHLSLERVGVTAADPACDLGDHCRSWTVNLNAGEILVTELVWPTDVGALELTSPEGEAKASVPITASMTGSNWGMVTFSFAPAVGGAYQLRVGAPGAMQFDLTAFTLPADPLVAALPYSVTSKFGRHDTLPAPPDYAPKYIDRVDVDLAAGQRLEAWLSAVAACDFELRLFGPDGGLVRHQTCQGNAIVLTHAVAAAGRYRVEVAGSKDGPYTLKLADLAASLGAAGDPDSGAPQADAPSGDKSAPQDTAAKQVKKVKLSKAKASVRVGKKLKLKVVIKPKSAKGAKLKWKSSNKRVATVNSKGVVKAKKKGKVRITATAKSGKRAVCVVRVRAR